MCESLLDLEEIAGEAALEMVIAEILAEIGLESGIARNKGEER